MAWLVLDGRVLASVELARTLGERTRGLIGRTSLDGAMLLEPARSVHTFRMSFPIDVAFCDRDLRVLRVTTLPPNRITLPVRRARVAIETEAGMLARWGLEPGDVLELHGSDGDSHPDDGQQADHRP